MSKRLICLVGVLGAALACGDRLVVPNYQGPTAGSVAADPANAVPLLVIGVLRSDRVNLPAYVLNLGVLGREAYSSPGNPTTLLTSDVNSSTKGGAVLWSGPYVTVRNAFNTLQVIDAADTVAVSTARRGALKGLLHTEIALNLLYAVNTRDSVGITVDTYEDPAKLAPFVSRDSALAYIAALLDKAQVELAVEDSIPALPSGFNGFTTARALAKFNRALAARVNAYRASIGASGCGAARSPTCYQQVLTNLQSSFLDPAGSFATGVFDVYSADASDFPNSLSNQATVNILAHAKTDSGVLVKADGTRDDRFNKKVIKLSSPRQPAPGVAGVPTSWDYSIYALRTDPIAVIRNEELILLRAEARYFTGNQAGALDDINLVRTKGGGLAARTSFSSEKDFLDELLYNRRWSLLFEGHRWIDMRRFGRLGDLTIDVPSHVVVAGLPLPQQECLQRANVSATLRGPGCPP